MSDQHTILYVMRHIDIGGHIEIPYKKVGITGAGNATLTSRLQQISSTKSPIKAQCIAAWEHHDARAVENAIHQLLDDSRVEGEWFLDKDDTLIERMQPIMDLLQAKEITIEGSQDSYTREILEREDQSKSAANKTLLAEISELLNAPMRSSIRKHGLTLFSDENSLTYYVNVRKSGRHRLHIGRSSRVYEQLEALLNSKDIDVEQASNGDVRLLGQASEMIAEIINLIESSGLNAG